jgi:hypothetical protein
MISTQITTKLFAALVLGQREHVPTTLDIAADATVASATPDVPHAGIVARDEFFSSHYKVFGPSSEPDIAALEAGTSSLRVRLALYWSHSDSGCVWLEERGQACFLMRANERWSKEGLKDWLPILLGFHKCHKSWAKSLFVHDTEVPREGETDGVATVILLDPKEEKKQVSTVVKLESMEQSLKLVHNLDFPAQQDTAWWVSLRQSKRLLNDRWPWALLEASQAYALEEGKLGIAQSIKVLSGFDVEVLESNDVKEKYKDKASLKDFSMRPLVWKLPMLAMLMI